MTALNDLINELAAAYAYASGPENTTGGAYGYLTFSSDMFATATTATPDGNGGYNLTPSGPTWTADGNPLVGGSGTAEPINISVPTLNADGAPPDPVALSAGILEFNIWQDGAIKTTIYGQIIGWNNGIVAFAAYDGYVASDSITDTPGLNSPDPTVPYFYLSASALGSNAAPLSGTDVNMAGTPPVFLDPQYPAVAVPLLLNNNGNEASSPGSATYYPTLVGMSFASGDVAVIGAVSQDPATLSLSIVAGNPLNETFANLSETSISVVNAWNDAQVVELQYTNNQGQVVDIYGQVIGSYYLSSVSELLLQVYSGFDPATETLTHAASDALMPYVLLSSSSLASIPTNSFSVTTGAPGAFNLVPWSLNLQDVFGVTRNGGITLTSDYFASASLASTTLHVQLDSIGNWTNDSDSTVGGNGTTETVKVDAVYDDWQVVEFTVSGGPQGSQTFYGQVVGWNGAEVGFAAYANFTDGPHGSLTNPLDFRYFIVANTPAAVDGAFPARNGDTDPDYFFDAANSVALPLFPNTATPTPNIDLTPLEATIAGGAISGYAFNTDNVASAGAVQQDPNTLALSLISAHGNETWSYVYAGGNNTAGSVIIANVYDANENVDGTIQPVQVAEVQYVPNGASAATRTVYAQLLGYNADALLLQVLPHFSYNAATATFTWYPDQTSTIGGATPSVNQAPYLVISDASLAATNGLPVDDVFTSNGILPVGLGPVTTLPSLCFCAGTLIATPESEVAVQHLAAGDTVLTQAGAARRVVWIGHGEVMVTRGRRSPATPVILRKGALADNVPHADLRVTKGHAVLLDGVLIPVEFLVNHRSILWDDQAQQVTVYHVELETHDVLLANGAPAESYRDDGNRWLFHNANDGWAFPPKPPCAPVLTGGAIVDEAWRRLLDRAGPRRQLPLTDDPDLHLLVDGRRIDPATAHDSLRIFTLPEAHRAVRIVSRSAVPAELGLARDPRELGVALRRLVLRQGTWFRVIDLADAALASGFYDYEPADCVRWTNGDAALPAALLAGPAGPVELVLHLGGSTRYIDDGRQAALVA